MDLQQLVAALTACTNPDATIRRAGEEAVKQVRNLFMNYPLFDFIFCILGACWNLFFSLPVLLP